MVANQQSMTAARWPVRTPPAVFAGFRPEFRNIKPAQWVTWKLGDTAAVGTTYRVATERLGEAVELGSGERVLNVTAGNGDTTLAQAEILPFRNAAFDVVLSGFGAMFAPDHERMARELLRVARRGGRIGLASWTPEGFNGQLIQIIDRYSATDSDRASPVLWGTREYLNELFGDSADALGAAVRSHTWRYQSPRAWLESWRSHGGPLNKACNAVDPDWRDQFTSELLQLVDRFNQADDGSMIVESEYLEFLVLKSTWRM